MLEIEKIAKPKGFGIRLSTVFPEVSKAFNERFPAPENYVSQQHYAEYVRVMHDEYNFAEDDGRAEYLDLLLDQIGDLLSPIRTERQLLDLFRVGRLASCNIDGSAQSNIVKRYLVARQIVNEEIGKRGFDLKVF